MTLPCRVKKWIRNPRIIELLAVLRLIYAIICIYRVQAGSGGLAPVQLPHPTKL